MKRCVYCGRENENNNKYCKYCGEEFDEQTYQSDGYTEVEPEVIYNEPNINEEKSKGPIKCPKCGSQEIFLLTRESNGFDASNACCGYIILGPLGLLCGLSGDKESMTARKCKNCGYEF
jgi:DNA-directed RNA polymerase subunit M/transcription elongation factor TFIIS